MPAATPLTRIALWFHRTLLVGGIVFYAVWNSVYGCWNMFSPECSGVYTVTVVMVGFGVVGSLLYRPKKIPQ